MRVDRKGKVPDLFVVHWVGSKRNTSVCKKQVDDSKLALSRINEFDIASFGRQVDGERNRAG